MIKLPAIFSSGAVFQQNSDIDFHGVSDKPACSVSAKLILVENETVSGEYSTQTDADGRFSISVHTPEASFSPYRIEISDGDPLILDNLLFGEVWLAVGQSNMEHPNCSADGNEDFYKSVVNHTIRYFRQNQLPETPYEPIDTLGGIWSDVRDIPNFGMISAVASSFAKSVYEFFIAKDAKVPVAILNCSLGGVPLESYLAREDVTCDDYICEYLKSVGRFPEKAKWNSFGASNYAQTTGLYNGKIYALAGIKCRGAIWYQGESNVGGRNAQKYYREALVRLHERFATLFKQPGQRIFPMISSQIHPYVYIPGCECLLNYINEAITDTVKFDSDDYAVVPVYDQPLKWDVVNNHPIHPVVKYTIGKRMASCAKSMVYGKNGVKSAPMESGSTVSGNKIIVRFENTGDGLITKNGETPRGFWICGENEAYLPAKATIISPDEIKLTNEFIDCPKFAAYNYAALQVDGNVYNSEGMPLSPFATDKTGVVNISAKPWLDMKTQSMWAQTIMNDLIFDVFYHPVWHASAGCEFCTDDVFSLTGTSLHIIGDNDRIGVSLHYFPGYALDFYRYGSLRLSVFNLDNDFGIELSIKRSETEKSIKYIKANKICDIAPKWAEYEIDFSSLEDLRNLGSASEIMIEKASFIFDVSGQKYKFVNIDNLRLKP